MLLEEALYSYLTGNPAVTARIGTRLYPMRVAEGSDLPAVAYSRVGATRTYTFDRFLEGSAWAETRIQFACYADTALEALETAHALLMQLSGYEGDMAGMYIGSARAALEVDTYEERPRKYRRLLDIIFGYEDETSGSQEGSAFSSAFSEAFS